MAEALEVYVIIYYLGGPAMALSAISISALSVFIKGGTFFIPGSLGAQDGGNVLVLEGLWIFRCHRHHLRVSPSVPGVGLDWIGLALLGSHRWAVGGNSGRQYSTTQTMVPDIFLPLCLHFFRSQWVPGVAC